MRFGRRVLLGRKQKLRNLMKLKRFRVRRAFLIDVNAESADSAIDKAGDQPSEFWEPCEDSESTAEELGESEDE